MALPPCFHLADEVFPHVRALAARRLVAQGWSQTRTAQALGLSQAMVSRHVAAPPPAPDPLVERLTAELEAGLVQGRHVHGANNAWCAALSVPEGDEALRDILDAERLLLEAAPLRLVPQIGLNLARAPPAATGPAQVLSFPGRLVDAGGRLVAPAPPAPGASGHLAKCLLRLMRRDPAALAIANVRGGPAVAEAARRLGWTVAQVAPRRAASDDEILLAIDQAADPRTVHDPGAVGIEPCLYLAGPDARSVAQRILALHDQVTS
ncbi:MAG TPA: thiamine-phosphate synthase family protein [Candidatus Thermoplasmatota archaeon]|nr:thiamine-phosphate synthase family protein [Candidatus Thermoplasmatota archaeon]